MHCHRNCHRNCCHRNCVTDRNCHRNGTVTRLAEGSLLQERPTAFALHRIERVAPTGEYFRFNAADDDARAVWS